MIESPILQKMLAEAKHEIILRVLAARFGQIPQDISPRLRRIRKDQHLNELLDRAAVCSNIEDFREAPMFLVNVSAEDWLKEPIVCLQWMDPNANDRKLRLFGCACCRRFWHLITDRRCREAVEIAEQFADGLVDSERLWQARESAREAVEENVEDIDDYENLKIFDAVEALTGFVTEYHPGDLAADTIRNHVCRNHTETEEAIQAALLLDLFGNPFRPVAVDPAWLTPDVTALAQAIYDERRFEHLPILADALEEAGCNNDDILSHCRDDGEHARGCWVVDLLLAKE